MISNRAARAICSQLQLTRRHNRLFCAEAEGEAKAAPVKAELDPHSRVVQSFMMELDKETCRKKGRSPSEVKPRENLSMIPVQRVINLVRKKWCMDNLRDHEPTDSDSEDENFAERAAKEREREILDKKLLRHQQLLTNFSRSESLDEAHSWMRRVDKFEDMHFKLRSEYRVIGELVNRLKVAQGKDQFLLQMKLNRALKIVQWKENFDPNDPANYTVLNKEQPGQAADKEEATQENEKPMLLGDEDDVMEFNDMKEKDNILMEKLTAIDKQLEERLAALDHTFGRKGKRLEEEIRDLAEERNSLTQQKRQPLIRKGFDVKLIDVNRTCKVTKGGQVIKYTALLVCGNYQGVIGYAKAKATAVPVALQKAHEKCFQNLHYVERHEDHTIAHAVQTSYKKTKLYLWPASTRSGVKAGRTVKTILNLAGFKNIKSKVIGSHNPHNTVKVVFQALNAVETGKDVQEKFGRTVVESHLL